MKVVAKVKPIKANISPYGQWHFANDYLYTADLYRKNPPHKGYSPVPYESYCIALELGLKAFLRAREMPVTEIEKVGHNFTKLLATAKDLDLEKYALLTEPQKKLIIQAGELFRGGKKIQRNNGHKNLSYSYVDIAHIAFNLGAKGALPLPDLGELHSVTEYLIQNLREICLKS